MTQTFTSETFYPQALCLSDASSSTFSIFQSWSGSSAVHSFITTCHSNGMIPQP
jgi:hypothetical protein